MIIILESLSSDVVTSAAVNCSISYSNNSIYHLHGSLPALTSLPQVKDSVNETYAVTMHISLNEQRVTTLYRPCMLFSQRMFQNKKRAHRTLPQNYVTLFGPGAAAPEYNGGPDYTQPTFSYDADRPFTRV